MAQPQEAGNTCLCAPLATTLKRLELRGQAGSLWGAGPSLEGNVLPGAGSVDLGRQLEGRGPQGLVKDGSAPASSASGLSLLAWRVT